MGSKFRENWWILRLLQSVNMSVVTQSPQSQKEKEQFAAMTRKLCDDYIEDRLIRAGLQLKERKFARPFNETSEEEDEGPVMNRPINGCTDSLNNSNFVGINRTVSAVSSTRGKNIAPKRLHFDTKNPEDISRALICVGEALESRHTSIYADVLTQLNIHMVSELTLKRAFYGVAKQLFSNGVSWAKIVSLFAFVGGLAVDCVTNGANMYVSRVKKWTVHYVTEELYNWIHLHGGWSGLVAHFVHNQKSRLSGLFIVLISVLVLAVAYLVSIIFQAKEMRKN